MLKFVKSANCDEERQGRSRDFVVVEALLRSGTTTHTYRIR
jgi:hypothetical protein